MQLGGFVIIANKKQAVIYFLLMEGDNEVF